MSKEKKQEIHVHHHYARPRAKPKKRSRETKAKKPNQFKDVKKAISISVNIAEQILRFVK